MIRLLLADDQALVRGALAALLDLEPDLEVVAEVGRGDEVVAAARRAPPTWRCSTSRCPAWTGSPPPRRCGRAARRAGRSMVTTFGRPGYLRRAMEAGASGFVVKDTPAGSWPTRSAGCTRAAGGRPGAGRRVAWPRRLSPLTERESDVLVAARERRHGRRHRPAAHLSEGTVRNHLSSAIGKTGARTRAEAVRLAEENGWLLG